jgi:hypothetical protein
MAHDLTSEQCDDAAVEAFCQAIQDDRDIGIAHIRLRKLCYELDDELDGVKLPRSAAAIMNSIRDMLAVIDGW